MTSFADLVHKSAAERQLLRGTNALETIQKAGARHWDPEKHPRGPDGRFIEVGDIIQLADGSEVRITDVGQGEHLRGEDARGKSVKINPEDIASIDHVNEGAGDRDLKPDPETRKKELDTKLRDAQKRYDDITHSMKKAEPGSEEWREWREKRKSADEEIDRIVDELGAISGDPTGEPGMPGPDEFTDETPGAESGPSENDAPDVEDHRQAIIDEITSLARELEEENETGSPGRRGRRRTRRRVLGRRREPSSR
jgi:hypothetical protein